jgi:hypothetical protein
VGYERPIWVTEFNHPYGSQGGEQQQADGLQVLMKRLNELQSKYRVEAAHVYELIDETYWEPDFEAYMGLVRLTATEGGGWELGEPKPAYAAVKNMVGASGPPRACDLAEMAELEPLEVRQVNYAYCLVLGRAATEGDVDAWAAALEADESSVADLVVAILDTDEFAGRYSAFSLTDRDYVEFLYKLLLERDPDAHGLDSYATELASGGVTRTGVALGLLNSSEFRSTHAPCFESEG